MASCMSQKSASNIQPPTKWKHKWPTCLMLVCFGHGQHLSLSLSLAEWTCKGIRTQCCNSFFSQLSPETLGSFGPPFSAATWNRQYLDAVGSHPSLVISGPDTAWWNSGFARPCLDMASKSESSPRPMRQHEDQASAPQERSHSSAGDQPQRKPCNQSKPETCKIRRLRRKR